MHAAEPSCSISELAQHIHPTWPMRVRRLFFRQQRGQTFACACSFTSHAFTTSGRPAKKHCEILCMHAWPQPPTIALGGPTLRTGVSASTCQTRRSSAAGDMIMSGA
eukprot:350928-Chlamydomonas_euryale.AAC.4